MESNVCRLCLSSENNGITNIFSRTGIKLKMSEIIREHFKSDVHEADSLPNVVCTMCWPIFNKEIRIELVKTEPIELPSSEDAAPISEENSKQQNDIGDIKDEEVNGDSVKSPEHESNAQLQNQKETKSGQVFRKRAGSPHTKKIAQKSVKQHKNKEKSDEEKFIAENFDMKCDQCAAVFKSLKEAQSHYRVSHNEPKGYVKCCGSKLRKPWEIRDHVKFHLNPEPFKCDTCGRCYTSHQILVQHKCRHKLTMNKSFICDFCGDHFRDKEAIERHLFLNHVKSKPKFKCEICSKRFHIQSLLKNRLVIVHQKKKLNTTCEICGKSFRTKCYLDEHMQSHADESTRFAQMKQCEHCGEWLMTRSGVYYHKQLHTSGVQKCKKCKIKLPNRLSLLAHNREYHRYHKFKCSFCAKRFGTGSELKKHEEFHTRHNVYQCAFCEKTYTVIGSVQLHVRKKHPEENKLSKEKKKGRIKGSNV